MNRTHAQIYESFAFADRERAALWRKSDWDRVSNVYKHLREYNEFMDNMKEMIWLARKAQENPRMYSKFKMTDNEIDHTYNLLNQYRERFFNLLYWWENSLERKYSDQTTYWNSSKRKFEPDQVEIIPNRLTGRGLRLSAQYMTGDSAAYPKWIALGNGVLKVRADTLKLTNELSRPPADYYASNGNIISSGVLASANIPTADISEFGGMNGPGDNADMVWMSVIENPVHRLHHVVTDNRPSCSHSLYLTSR